jgi:hypothetical protein
MQTLSLFNAVQLVGSGVFRCHTMAWPREVVERLLPWGMELADNPLTDRDHHPVSLFFQDMIRAHMTVPNALPNLTYHEQIVGIPFVKVTKGYGNAGPLGPFFYMPNLWLDSFWATLGGRLYWGFNKQVGTMSVRDGHWAVLDPQDPSKELIALDYEVVEEDYKPLAAHPHFQTYARAITGIMSQPLVSMLPGGYPLMPICSNFDKRWSRAVVRPLRTRVSIHRSFLTGLPTGTFPGLEGWQDSIAELPWGGFEALAQWRLTVPYPCQLWQPYPEEG